MTLTVTKAHAYGNDFLFVAEDDLRGADLAGLARTLCARHTGIGADGLIVYYMSGCVDGTAGDHVMISPPLVVTEPEVDEALEVLARVFG